MIGRLADISTKSSAQKITKVRFQKLNYYWETPAVILTIFAPNLYYRSLSRNVFLFAKFIVTYLRDKWVKNNKSHGGVYFVLDVPVEALFISYGHKKVNPIFSDSDLNRIYFGCSKEVR